jgi:hypothetical protein
MSHRRRIGQRPDSQRRIDAFAHEVLPFVVEYELNPQSRMLICKTRQMRQDAAYRR